MAPTIPDTQFVGNLMAEISDCPPMGDGTSVVQVKLWSHRENDQGYHAWDGGQTFFARGSTAETSLDPSVLPNCPSAEQSLPRPTTNDLAGRRGINTSQYQMNIIEVDSQAPTMLPSPLHSTDGRGETYNWSVNQPSGPIKPATAFIKRVR